MGEDPHLAGQMAAAETKGIQSQGVVACAKHWADNNQEGPGHNGRLSTSSLVDDRANFELYYRNFSCQHLWLATSIVLGLYCSEVGIVGSKPSRVRILN